MKKSLVYTKTGDRGTTGLIGGTRVSKTHIRLEAYGTVDELNANLGLLITYLNEEHDREFLLHVQNKLFAIGSHLATDHPLSIAPKGSSLLWNNECHESRKHSAERPVQDKYEKHLPPEPDSDDNVYKENLRVRPLPEKVRKARKQTYNRQLPFRIANTKKKRMEYQNR